jgi:hypothetical protein
MRSVGIGGMHVSPEGGPRKSCANLDGRLLTESRVILNVSHITSSDLMVHTIDTGDNSMYH